MVVDSPRGEFYFSWPGPFSLCHEANGLGGHVSERRHDILKLFVVVLAVALMAAACGDGDSENDGGDGGAAGITEAQQDEQSDVSTERDEGDATGEDTSDDPSSGPVHGGRLVYGVEADTANPWTHYGALLAISGRMILRAVTDPLFITNQDAAIVPYLAESVAPNEDYSQWTMVIREGITFHDGTALDGAAVAYNIDTCRFSQLAGSEFIGLVDVAAEGQTVTLTYGQPDAVGPMATLRAETCGLMLSPAWLQTLADNPLLSEPEAADADGNSAAPVGLGAFVFESYTPGNGNSFVALRNDDYWRGENGITGEQLPYLDEVEFVVVADVQSRSNGLKAGQFDIIHTANADEVAKYEGDDDVVLLQANDFGETNYVLVNTAQGTNPVVAFLRGVNEVQMDPLGLNSLNPLVNLSCRRALAHAIDQQRIADERGAGLESVSNGPFPPGSIGYLEDTGYPAYDPDQALVDWEQCKLDSGQNPVTFTYNTTNDPFNVETNELVVSMWRDVFGDEIAASIAPIEQGVYIDLAVAGVFEAQAWRSHGGVDPTEQWFYWNTATANPVDPTVPELALNFGRFQDPEMDLAYETIRQKPDPAARRAAAEEVNRLFAKNVWNWWTTWALWGIIADERLQDLTNLTIPGTNDTTFPVIAGKHHLTQIWCVGGDCQG